MRIFVDEDKCCGSGQCVLLAPELFDQRDEDGIVLLLDAHPSEEHRKDAGEAVSMCPTGAIELRDTD